MAFPLDLPCHSRLRPCSLRPAGGEERLLVLTHGSGHRDAGLWRASPLLNLWPLLPDLLVGLPRDSGAGQGQRERRQRFPRSAPCAFPVGGLLAASSQRCFSDPNTSPRLLRDYKGVLGRRVGASLRTVKHPHVRLQEGRHAELAPDVFSKVCGDRCVIVASVGRRFAPPTDWPTAAPRGPRSAFISESPRRRPHLFHFQGLF